MVRKIIWSLQAQYDRMDIFDYWNRRNHSFAYSNKLNTLITEKLEFASVFPKSGKAVQRKDTRFLTVEWYLVFYKIYPDKLIVLRLWDGRQNPERLNNELQ